MRVQKYKVFRKKMLATTSLFFRRASLLGLCLLLSLIQVAFVFVLQPQKASASVSFVGATTDTSAVNTNENSVTISAPGAVQEDDIMIAFVSFNSASADPYINAPDGTWTEIAKTSASGITMRSFWKLATGSGGSYTFTTTGGNTRAAGGIAAYRGASTAAPVDGVSTVATGGGAGSYSAPATSTIYSDIMNIALFSNLSAAPGSFTQPSGMAERVDVATSHSTENDVNINMADVPQLSAGSISSKTTTVTQTGAYTAHQFALRPADPARLMLFWDGATAPSGWSFLTAANDRYIRGETPENYGLGGGSALHTPTVSTVATANANSTIATGANQDVSSGGHTHPAASVSSVGSANNLPRYRSLKIIQFDGGIPEFIPSGAIALFDSTPGIPADEISPGVPLWTQYSAQDGYFLRADDTVAVGGNVDNVHTHSISWNGLGAGSGAGQRTNLLASIDVASVAHTHNAPGGTTTATNGTDPCDVAPVADSCLPPYVDILLAKIGQDTQTLSLGFTAMFDKDPGGGWVLRSDDTGASVNPYYQKFFKAEATYNDNGGAGLGSATHTHSNATAITGQAIGSGQDTVNIGGAGVARQNHTHQLSATFDPVSNIPEYYNVVVAEKVNLTLENYRWFEDNDTADVTDPWSSQDIAEGRQISITPVANDAPRTNRELRLRIQLGVDNNDLVAGGIAFKLQYKKGTDGECDTDTWIDVGDSASGAIWRYATSSVSNGADLSAFLSRFTTTSNVMQLYVNNPNAGNNPYSVGVGNTMEYDFHIQHNGAEGATQYSFRVVEDSGPGVLLSEYVVCPTLETFPDTNQQLRHGKYFEVNAGEGGFTWSE